MAAVAIAVAAVGWLGLRPRLAHHESATSAVSTNPNGGDAHFANVLGGLDALRERAFAQGSTALLDDVYSAGPLLTQDSALIERIVPSGCGLIGVHTGYRDVHAVTTTSDRTVVTAAATLAASTLMCGATLSGALAGTPLTRLRIELVSRGSGYRIVSQQVIG